MSENEKEYVRGRLHGYSSGYYAAVSDAMNFLNTIEDKRVDKKVIYAALMDMRPLGNHFPNEFVVDGPVGSC